MHVALFFTWDVSLQLWKEKGLFEREVRLYEELSKRGVKFTFFTWGDESDWDIEVPFADIVPIYTIIPRPHNKIIRFLYSFYVPFKVKNTLKGVDLIKTNQMWGAWVPVFLKFLAKNKLLVRTGYELYDFTCRQGHGVLRKVFIKLLSRMVYGVADHVFLATVEDKAHVQRVFDIPANTITLQPNWIDTDVFKPLNVPQKNDRLLFIGRLEVQKNLEKLIKAVAKTEFTLDIIGDGTMKKDLVQLAHRVGAQVEFLGKVPNDQLPAVYNQYPLYILCSYYEGNPKTLLEAMACGRPVLGTRVTGIQSVIENGITGYLCEIDASSIASAIVTTMNDPERLSVGKAARAQILQNQTLDKAVDNEMQVYQRLGIRGA